MMFLDGLMPYCDLGLTVFNEVIESGVFVLFIFREYAGQYKVVFRSLNYS